MAILRYLACAAVVMSLVIAGCGEKKSDEFTDAEFSEIPTLENETAAQEEESSDIFDEFYDDEGTESVQPAAEPQPEPVRESFGTPSTAPQFVDNGRYVVQVSCVASRQIGIDVAEQLRNRGYPAYVAEVQNPTASLIGTYYRVRIGSFNSISAARDFGRDVLAPAGYDFWIDNKSNDNVGMDGYGLGEPAPAATGYESSYQSTEPVPEPQPSSSDNTGSTFAADEDQWGVSGSGESGAVSESTEDTGAWGSESSGETPAAVPEEEPAAPSSPADEQPAANKTQGSDGSATPSAETGTQDQTGQESTGTESGWGEEDWGDDW